MNKTFFKIYKKSKIKNKRQPDFEFVEFCGCFSDGRKLEVYF